MKMIVSEAEERQKNHEDVMRFVLDLHESLWRGGSHRNQGFTRWSGNPRFGQISREQQPGLCLGLVMKLLADRRWSGLIDGLSRIN